MSGIKPSQETPTIISFARDLPNVCSLVGLFCAVLAIYFAILGNFPATMIGLAWAVFFDWSDGKIARRMKGRHDKQRMFGGQLDSLIDIVSFGICPAIVLLSYGEFSPWFVPGAFCIVAAGVLRLSYFNVYGLVGESTYQGLAIDNNGIILTLLFLLDGFLGPLVFVPLLYVVVMGLAIANVAPIRTPKLEGAWYYVIIVYTLALTFIFGWRLFSISG
jgi:phosphatidylserine synthase